MKQQDFNPSRLAVARKRRGMTKKALAEAVDLSTRSLTAYEAGNQQPTQRHIDRFVAVLGFPHTFFKGSDLDDLPPEDTSFRALSMMTSRQRDQATAAGQLVFCLADWIDSKFDLPKHDIPRLQGINPETSAIIVRKEWNLGERRISNMIHLLEVHGVRVFSLVEECKEVDAYSCWRQYPGSKKSVPFVFLNTMKSAERSRMDAAHELGHLVLHWGREIPRRKDIEKEAKEFASAFLMPEASVRAKPLRGGTLGQIIKAKEYWGVSVSALVYRLYQLEMLSYWKYNNLFIQISQNDYKTNEPNGIARETSQVLVKAFEALREEGVSRADITRDLCLPLDELNKLIFGLVLTKLSGEGVRDSFASTKKPSFTVYTNK